MFVGADYMCVNGLFWEQNETSCSDPADNKGNPNIKGKNGQESKQKGHQGSEKTQKAQAFTNQMEFIDGLLLKISCQESKIKMLEKQSKKINESYANVTEVKGTFENVNDSLANINIAEIFNNLYDNDWVKMLKWLGTTFPNISEIELIHKITDLLKNGYKECLQLADAQIRECLMLDEAQCLPDYIEHLEFYALRKQHVQSDIAREKVKQKVTKKLFYDEEVLAFCTVEIREETKQRLTNFLNKYVDCCWVMVVSTPPIALNFEVVRNPYCKEHFRVYSPKKPVEDKSKEAGTVYEVVWPSVSLKDGSAFYKKGDVIVVPKGADKEEINENGECSCPKIACNKQQS